MPHRIGASVDRDKHAVRNSRPDHLFGHPEADELPPPNDAVLTSRQAGDLTVKSLSV